MLAELNLRVNYVVDLASVDDLAKCSEAAATVGFCYTLSSAISSYSSFTYNAPEKYRSLIEKEYENLAEDVSTSVEFVEDGYIVGKLLKETDFGSKPPIIFGTTWERDTAKELNGYIVEIGFPASYEVVINKSYIGYRGALTLIEKIYSTAISKSA